ncbi:interferon lambda-3-like [Chelydra serpentina]|uniref:Interferon lambda-3-like n=1 Tax=Chelydra serpentina TaxID=8475 RepID=A0A8T1SGH9_CHESE|nr:interferon lambda-3-like [Chelydra serpentina]
MNCSASTRIFHRKLDQLPACEELLLLEKKVDLTIRVIQNLSEPELVRTAYLPLEILASVREHLRSCIQLKGLDQDAAPRMPILAKWLRKSHAGKSEPSAPGRWPPLAPLLLLPLLPGLGPLSARRRGGSEEPRRQQDLRPAVRRRQPLLRPVLRGGRPAGAARRRRALHPAQLERQDLLPGGGAALRAQHLVQEGQGRLQPQVQERGGLSAAGDQEGALWGLGQLHLRLLLHVQLRREAVRPGLQPGQAFIPPLAPNLPPGQAYPTAVQIPPGQAFIAPLAPNLLPGQDFIPPLTSNLLPGQAFIPPLAPNLPPGQAFIPPLTSNLLLGQAFIPPLTKPSTGSSLYPTADQTFRWAKPLSHHLHQPFRRAKPLSHC